MLWETSVPLKGNFVIILDGNDYLDSTEKMEIRGNDASRRLDVEEVTDFRSVVSSIGYMATAFIPGLSVEASMLVMSYRQSCPQSKCYNQICKWASTCSDFPAGS
jgi:hypothetical protein